jgi:hypothetical protein
MASVMPHVVSPIMCPGRRFQRKHTRHSRSICTDPQTNAVATRGGKGRCALAAPRRDAALDGGWSDIGWRGGSRTRGFQLDSAVAADHSGRGNAQTSWRMLATKHTEDPLHAPSPVIRLLRQSHGRARWAAHEGESGCHVRNARGIPRMTHAPRFSLASLRQQRYFGTKGSTDHAAIPWLTQRV